MQYQTVVPGRFLARPNRFIALVDLDGRQEAVHVKIPGGAGNCWSPARRCIWRRGRTPGGRPLTT